MLSQKFAKIVTKVFCSKQQTKDNILNYCQMFDKSCVTIFHRIVTRWVTIVN
jgi:hypothetical protein